MMPIERLHQRLDDLEKSNKEDLVNLQTKFDKDIAELKKEAFPDEDLDSHFNQQKRQIERAQEWKDNGKGLRTKLFEGAGWAAVVAIAGALWVAFKAQVNS